MAWRPGNAVRAFNVMRPGLATRPRERKEGVLTRPVERRSGRSLRPARRREWPRAHARLRRPPPSGSAIASYAPPSALEAGWPPPGRAGAADEAREPCRSRSSVAETPPTTGVPGSTTYFLHRPVERPPNRALCRPAGWLNGRPVIACLAQRRLMVEVMGQLDQPQSRRTRTQGARREDDKRLDQDVARRAVDSRDSPTRKHLD